MTPSLNFSQSWAATVVIAWTETARLQQPFFPLPDLRRMDAKGRYQLARRAVSPHRRQCNLHAHLDPSSFRHLQGHYTGSIRGGVPGGHALVFSLSMNLGLPRTRCNCPSGASAARSTTRKSISFSSPG